MLPLFDAHCDTAVRMVEDGADPAGSSPAGHIDAPRLLTGGVACQVFAACAPRSLHGDDAVPRARRLLDAARSLDGRGPFTIPHTRADLAALGGTGGERVGVLLAVEGGAALGGDPAAVAELSDLGVRYLTLAWEDNDLAGAGFGVGRGLTPLGREVLAELTAHRVLVDLSHASDATVEDVLAATTAPLIATHSNARALCASPRNLTDDQARAIADTGGVVGVTFVTGFLDEGTRALHDGVMKRHLGGPRMGGGDPRSAMKRAYAEVAELLRPPMTVVADHVEHLVSVAGIEAVGFGSDFDGLPAPPEGLEDCSCWPALIEVLEARGYGQEELRKLCWGNWERVFGWTFG